MLHVVLQINALLPLLIGDDGAPAWVRTGDWPASTVVPVTGLALCLDALGGALTGPDANAALLPPSCAAHHILLASLEPWQVLLYCLLPWYSRAREG
jgi:hypothetical protein